MNDILWIVPNLNEDFEVIKTNVNKMVIFSQKNNFSYKILVMDGGSNYKLLKKIKNLVNDNILLLSVLPAMRPTKNKGIKDALFLFKSKIVCIVDADCLNLNNYVLKNLTKPVLSGKYDISLPFVTKSGGRINRLVCNPLLHLLLPEVRKKIKFPLSGIISLRYELLKSITKKEDYFWDWGGEIQILIQSVLNTNKINQFHFNKIDAKKRSMQSKRVDSLQITRAILYEYFKQTNSIRYTKKSIFKGRYSFTNFEKYCIDELVSNVFDEVFLNKQFNRKTMRNISASKIDFLEFTKAEKAVTNIYENKLSNSLNKKNIQSFMKKVGAVIKNQKSFNDTRSIDIFNMKNEQLFKLSKVYNSKMSNHLKINNILKIK